MDALKDGRVTTSSEKQIHLFKLLLDKINGKYIQCSDNTQTKIDELYKRYKSDKLSLETIVRKANTLSKIVRSEDRREFYQYNDGKINIVENHIHLQKEKYLYQYYLILPKEAKNHILQIFTYGIMSKKYGGLYETNPLPKCTNFCVVELYFKKSDLIKIERNLFEQHLQNSNLQNGLYYKDDVIPVKNIIKIQYND